MSVLTALKAYRRDVRGNVAMMLAICMFALAGGLALAIDLSNAWSAKQRLQDTTDAVALLAAKDKTLVSTADLQAAADTYYMTHFPDGTGDRIIVNSIQRDGDRVTVDVSNNIDTYFTGIFGRKGQDIRVESSAVFAEKNLDIALVLDTTFSMNGSKLASLKTAANGLVTEIEGQTSDNVRLSVVPFSQYVNVGLSRRNKPWLDVEPDGTKVGERVCRMKRDVTSRSNCRRVARTCTNDGVSYDCSYRTCDKTYGRPYRSCYTPKTKQVWNGCVGSREAGLDEVAQFGGSQIPGLVNVKCGSELQELSSNMTQAKATISGLSAQGETYIPAGLLWGWRTLDSDMPLRDTRTSNASEKVLVLMTDGENQRSKDGIRHTSKNKNAANRKTDALCAAIKGSDIQVYTIAYEVTDSSTLNMLRNCATDNTKFFDADNAAELNQAFNEIASALNELRITA